MPSKSQINHETSLEKIFKMTLHVLKHEMPTFMGILFKHFIFFQNICWLITLYKYIYKYTLHIKKSGSSYCDGNPSSFYLHTFVVGLCMCMTMWASSSLGCMSSSRSFGWKVLSFVEIVIEIWLSNHMSIM
jgi:hypothetical protein